MIEAQEFNVAYRHNVELIRVAIAVEDELENSVVVNALLNALKKDAEEATATLPNIDLGDTVALRMIQLRVSMHHYIRDLIVGFDNQHQAAALRIQDLEKDMNYEQE